MAAINFHAETDLAPSDPSDLPCLFVGKLEHIKAAGYSGVAKFLGDKVDQKVICFNTCNAPRCILMLLGLYESWNNLMRPFNACMLMFLCKCAYMVLHNNALYGIL